MQIVNTRKNAYIGLKTLLLSSSIALIASPAAFAQTTPAPAPAAPAAASETEALQKRIKHLEGLLEKVMERLDAKEQMADPAAVLRTRELFEGMRREQEVISRKMAESDGFMAEAKKRMSTDGFRVGKSTIRIGGFLKYDASVTRYSAGDTAPGAFIDDFYLPQQIPVALRGAKRPEGFDFNNNVRESRLFFAGETDVGKDKLSGRLEIDFQSVNTNADERATNGFSPEIRHAWIQWNNVLAGQNWSLLQNVTVLPDSLEFIGPVEGMVFCTTHEDETTIWTLVNFDRLERCCRYVRCTPTSRTAIVEVRCTELASDRTQVQVSYAMTALNSHGEEILTAFSEQVFKDMIDRWQLDINRDIDRLLEADIK